MDAHDIVRRAEPFALPPDEVRDARVQILLLGDGEPTDALRRHPIRRRCLARAVRRRRVLRVHCPLLPSIDPSMLCGSVAMGIPHVNRAAWCGIVRSQGWARAKGSGMATQEEKQAYI